jgi:tRNA pseudouridine13 synthase
LSDSLAAPHAHGAPPATGRIREAPADFRVEELLGFEVDGSGHHALLVVEKTGANTGWVAAQLARLGSVDVREVGFSGHKDRHASTRQSFTLPWAATRGLEECLQWRGEGYEVVSAARHGRKLRPGSHRANRFELRVRELHGDPTALESRLRTIAESGVPNYFGPQRFGRDGANLERARAWASGGPAPRDRAPRAFALSAARSHIFNSVLAARVRRGDWDRLLPGEAVLLDGRRSFFVAAAIDAELEGRCRAMDVHPSGPLEGRGTSPALDEALSVERRAVDDQAALAALLSAERTDHERRSLRLPVREFDWQHEDATTLTLRFTLPRGTFATAVLHELLADAWDTDEGGD